MLPRIPVKRNNFPLEKVFYTLLLTWLFLLPSFARARLILQVSFCEQPHFCWVKFYAFSTFGSLFRMAKCHFLATKTTGDQSLGISGEDAFSSVHCLVHDRKIWLTASRAFRLASYRLVSVASNDAYVIFLKDMYRVRYQIQ